jgi:hypothetical protein
MKKQANGGRSLIASFVASALASAACGPNVTWAQDAGATLEGKAEANTEITVKNVDTGLTRRTKAGPDGTYAIVGLPAGTYNVDAGPGMQQVVTLNVATTETLNLEQLATVTVSGTAHRLAEVKTSEIGTIISQQQIETVPQLTRNCLEFADTVPGMQFKVDSSGNTSLQGGAMSTSTVNGYIDGVGQKNYVKEGGVSGQFFSQGNPFPELAIGERPEFPRRDALGARLEPEHQDNLQGQGVWRSVRRTDYPGCNAIAWQWDSRAVSWSRSSRPAST